jgi:hypothetical protein
MMNSTKRIVCHSGAINLRLGFGCGSVAVDVVAIFVLAKDFGVQNISGAPPAGREVRSANPESHGTLDTRVLALFGRESRDRAAFGYASGLDMTTKWQGNLDLISSGKGAVPVST